MALTGSDTDSQADRREEAAGGVVFRRRGAGVEVAVAEQHDRIRGDLRLRLPKGKAEPGETPEETALREVREETGLVARIVGTLEDVAYVYRDRRGRPVDKRVRFYLMEYESGDPQPLDGEMERVFWCTPAEACAQLSFATEQHVMELARAHLQAPEG
jgi:8-oxo-dGTP pyrophosphatase MutT (NUDIX family)